MTAAPGELPVPLVRRQLPVRVAYCMTINRAQGQTLVKVGVLLEEPCFAHGQLYVAFSRAKNAESVRVWAAETQRQGNLTCSPEQWVTDNVVYRELLV